MDFFPENRPTIFFLQKGRKWLHLIPYAPQTGFGHHNRPLEAKITGPQCCPHVPKYSFSIENPEVGPRVFAYVDIVHASFAQTIDFFKQKVSNGLT